MEIKMTAAAAINELKMALDFIENCSEVDETRAEALRMGMEAIADQSRADKKQTKSFETPDSGMF